LIIEVQFQIRLDRYLIVENSSNMMLSAVFFVKIFYHQ